MSDVTTAAPPEPPQPPPPSGVYAPAPPPQPPKNRGGGAAWGVILLIVGVVLLLGRFVPAFSWWTLWPLVIVVAGLVQALTPGKDGWSVAKLFDGLVTVAFGGVFLAITTGVVGWNVWARIFTFWPVLVIALGLELLSKALHSSWPKILGSLAIIAALAYSVGVSASGVDSTIFDRTRTGGTSYSLDEPVGSVDEADLKLAVGAARVRMAGGSDLVSVEGRSPFGRPSIDVDRSTRPANVDVKLGEDDQMMMWPGDFTADFDVNLSDDVLWDLLVTVGVADFSADFSDLSVSGLDLKPGVANCEVKMGDVPDGVDEGRIHIESGISSVRLSIPDDAEASIQIESGLSGNDVRGDFESRGGGTWETAGFDEASADGDPVWIIVVKSGIGSITIDTY